jgi:hypothetical protein
VAGWAGHPTTSSALSQSVSRSAWRETGTQWQSHRVAMTHRAPLMRHPACEPRGPL